VEFAGVEADVSKCVPESLKLKREVVKDLDALTSPETVIASNSSSHTISEIVAGLLLNHPERMASLHSCECLTCTWKERFHAEKC
jgi:3-hydroxyacyl-CoA dehydrogenase